MLYLSYSRLAQLRALTLQNDLGGHTVNQCPCARVCLAEKTQHLTLGGPVFDNKCGTLSLVLHKIEHTFGQGSRGTWCSGITSASHAEGPGFNPQCVHSCTLQHVSCSSNTKRRALTDAILVPLGPGSRVRKSNPGSYHRSPYLAMALQERWVD